MEATFYEDPQGRFRARLPSTWQVGTTEAGAATLSNTVHPKGAMTFSFLAMRPVGSLTALQQWKAVRDFPHELETGGRGQTVKSWTVNHGLTMAMVTYVYNSALGHLERKEADAILDSIEIAARPIPSGSILPKPVRWLSRLWGR